MYKINFYVPESHLDRVKNAMFAQGAGKIGDYECCAWQTKGIGQFRPLAGSQPFCGEVGEICQVEEYMVEMICEAKCLSAVLQALLAAHPYEAPAYVFWPINYEVNSPG